MRIVGGSLRGKRFQPPRRMPARPTTDFAKEGLFNILEHRLDWARTRYLDLFAGTGNLCYEIGSRGCTDITAVEKDPGMTRFIRENAEAFGLDVRVVPADVFRFLDDAPRRGEAPWTLIFAGPPYPLPNLDEIPDRLLEAGVLAPEGIFVLEHNPNHDFSGHPHRREERKYGQTRFSFFGAQPSPDAP